MDLKWYSFDQNNSGGYYIRNREVQELVFIQAPTERYAKYRAQEIFCGNDSYCECCGERWSYYLDEGTDVPEVFGTPIDDLTENDWRYGQGVVMYPFEQDSPVYAKAGKGVCSYEALGDDE